MNKTDKRIMMASYLAFSLLILASNGCGNTNSSGTNENGLEAKLGANKSEYHRIYEKCAIVALKNRCIVDEAQEFSGQLTRIDFYDHYCFRSYRACVRGEKAAAFLYGRYALKDS